MSEELIPHDFERAATLGLARANVDDAQALTSLALLAQRKRHHRIPSSPAAIDLRSRELHTDPRAILPDAARRPLLRLAGSLNKEGWQYLAQAVFDRLDERAMRLHPFDLPRLEALLDAAADRLGQAERAWLALRRTPHEPAAAAPASNEADWALLPKPQKIALIRQMRRQDGATARNWIEHQLPASPADVRAALIGALEVCLSEDDVPFLTEVANSDRATSVRDGATALMARIRGTPAYDARLAASSTFVAFGRTLLGRRTVKFKAEALASLVQGTATTGSRNAAFTAHLYRELQGFSFTEIAGTWSMTPEDLAGALTADDPLTSALAVSAIIEAEPRVLEKMAAHIARLDVIELLRQFEPILSRLSKPARASLLNAAAHSPRLEWRGVWDLHLLGRLVEGPLPEAIARKLLRAWSPSQQYDATTLAVFASLMPRDRDADFAALIADLPRKDTAATYEYFAFTTELQGTAA